MTILSLILKVNVSVYLYIEFKVKTDVHVSLHAMKTIKYDNVDLFQLWKGSLNSDSE